MLSTPAPEHHFSNTGSSVLTTLSSCPLYDLASEFTRHQWLLSHEASLLPWGYGTRRQQPAREACSGAALAESAHYAATRQAGFPPEICEFVVRATLAQEKKALPQCQNSDNYRLANPGSEILSLVLFKISMHWGLEQFSIGKEGWYLN